MQLITLENIDIAIVIHLHKVFPATQIATDNKQ